MKKTIGYKTGEPKNAYYGELYKNDMFPVDLSVFKGSSEDAHEVYGVNGYDDVFVVVDGRRPVVVCVVGSDNGIQTVTTASWAAQRMAEVARISTSDMAFNYIVSWIFNCIFADEKE